MDHDSAVPPYRQLAAILRDQITSGELAPGAMVPPVKRLRRFVKVSLDAGASTQLHFSLSRADLSYIGAAGKPVSDRGIFTVMIGSLRQDVTIR